MPAIIFDTSFGNIEGNFGTKLSLRVLELHGEQKKKTINDDKEGAGNDQESRSDSTFLFGHKFLFSDLRLTKDSRTYSCF